MNIVSRHADDPEAMKELDNYMLTGGADNKVFVWDLRHPLNDEGSAVCLPSLIPRAHARHHAGGGFCRDVHGLLSARSAVRGHRHGVGRDLSVRPDGCERERGG